MKERQVQRGEKQRAKTKSRGENAKPRDGSAWQSPLQVSEECDTARKCA